MYMKEDNPGRKYFKVDNLREIIRSDSQDNLCDLTHRSSFILNIYQEYFACFLGCILYTFYHYVKE